MTTETLETRVAALETEVAKLQQKLTDASLYSTKTKRGWRWFVGIFADSPDFDEVVRIGKEWRYADRPEEV